MRKHLLASAGIVLAAAACTDAEAAKYIQIPLVPGAQSQQAIAINNSNIVAGSFRDPGGVAHGFFGPFDGSNFTTFDHNKKGVTGTMPRYISDSGAMAGFSTKSGFTIGQEWFRMPNGRFRTFKHRGHPLDGVAAGINAGGQTVGDYFNDEGIRMGFVGKRSAYRRDFHLKIAHYTRSSPRGITDVGKTFVGLFDDKNNVQHGFVQTDKDILVIDYPGDTAIQTILEDINESGVATGQWVDSGGSPHAFLIDMNNGDITDLDPGDGSSYQQAWGINDQGLVALSTSIGQSYIYCPLPNKECPDGGFHATVHVTHVPPSTFLKHDRFGRTGHGRPFFGKRMGEIQ